MTGTRAQDAVSSVLPPTVRLYVAAMYEFKSVKWLSGMEAIDRVIPDYLVGSSNGRGVDERI